MLPTSVSTTNQLIHILKHFSREGLTRTFTEVISAVCFVIRRPKSDFSNVTQHSMIQSLLIHPFPFAVVLIQKNIRFWCSNTDIHSLLVHWSLQAVWIVPLPWSSSQHPVLTYIYHLPRVLLLLLLPPSLISLHLSPSLPLWPPSLSHVPSLAAASKPCSVHARFPIFLFFLLCVCPSLPTLHLYHAASNKFV